MSPWTTADMPDCSGKTVVVTGANSGLGFEVTRVFASKGATVVMACRDLDRAEDARASIRSAHSVPADGGLDVAALDLAALDSIRSFAETITDEYGCIDVLCNNAGVMAIPRTETADGFEMHVGVNHLGHFALTGLVFDALHAADDPRVVIHSSGMHTRGRIDFTDLHGEQTYDPWAAYAQSKLANILFAYELDRRYGDMITSVTCHPGYAATNLQRRGPEQRGSKLRLFLVQIANRVIAQSTERGALPMLYAATTDTVDGGEYVGPDGFRRLRGYPEIQRSSSRSYDEESAARLWQRSTDLTDVTYP